jgi:tetratricopeptide (TPR) repeat protein
MHKQPQREIEASTGWTAREAYLLAVVCLMVGLGMGYMIRGSAGSDAVATAAVASQPAVPAANTQAPGPDVEMTAAPLKVALSSDPRNFDLLVQLGNLYYDKRVYTPAAEYYQRALALRPNEVGVRTDLGTAYWYSGFPDKAIAEYRKSLQVDPNHPQTLFNMGVVYKDGLKEPSEAIATWEKLLKVHPEYTDRQKVLDLIKAAKSQIS